MFTVADIRDIAIQIETNGELAYRQASKNAADPEIATLFEWMADEEQRHAAFFATIESDQELTSEQQALEEMGRGLLKEMIADQTFSLNQQELQKVKTFQEMVSQSKSFEQDTILFYEFLKGVLDDEKACQTIDLIIAEERNHVNQLAELESSNGTILTPA